MSGPLDFGDEGGRERLRPEPRPEPPAEPPPPARPPGASRYGWFIGVAAFLLLAVVTINSITTGGGQPGGPAGGDRLVAFAVPLADAPSRPDEDANVDRERACRVRGAGILNMCEQWERGPVVLALFPTNADRCRAVMDQLERMRARFPEVAFVAVGSAGDRDQLKGRSPLLVGWDRDRAVASVYGLVGCPQVSFATKGGKVIDTVRREIGDAEFARKVEALR